MASPRGFGRNSKKICLVSNGRNIILISFGINHHLSQIQCTQTCNSTQAEGSYCLLWVVWHHQKPAHWKNWSHGSHLTRMFGLTWFFDGWVQLSSRETLATFSNPSETIPYHACMDYDDLLTGGKMATFFRGNGLVNIPIPWGIFLGDEKLGPYRLFRWRRFASKKSSRIWTYTKTPEFTKNSWLENHHVVLIGRFIFKRRLGFPASHVRELGGCINYSSVLGNTLW